jgi:WhiB family transcriptional regulator, redox-sensing transcriptional regulator
MADLLETDWDEAPTQAPTLTAVEQIAAEAQMTQTARVEALMVLEAAELAALLDIGRRPAWHAQAACQGMGTDTFFPERGQDARPAAAICDGCDVRADCLAAALAVQDTQGIWGGLSQRGRRVLRRVVA